MVSLKFSVEIKDLNFMWILNFLALVCMVFGLGTHQPELTSNSQPTHQAKSNNNQKNRLGFPNRVGFLLSIRRRQQPQFQSLLVQSTHVPLLLPNPRTQIPRPAYGLGEDLQPRTLF